MGSEKRYTPSVSLKEAEKEFLEKRAKTAGLKYTTYMREVALENIPQDEANFSKYEHTQALKDLRKEVIMIGNNLNQIARVANTTGSLKKERINNMKKQILSIKKRIAEELI